MDIDALEYAPSGSMTPFAGDLHLNIAGPIANVLNALQSKAAASAPSVAASTALSDSALSQALVTWVSQAKPALMNSNPPLPYQQMLSFFSDSSNMPYVRAAMTNYGIQLVPLISVRGNVQYNAGSWVNYYRLWRAASYYATFPIPVSDPANCTQIQTMIPLVAQEIANIKAQQTQGTLTTQEYTNTIFVLNDIQTTITGMYGKLDCVNAEQQQQTASNIATTNAVTQAALNNPSGMSGIAGIASNTLLYGIAGLFVLGAIIVIFHHSSKKAA